MGPKIVRKEKREGKKSGQGTRREEERGEGERKVQRERSILGIPQARPFMMVSILPVTEKEEPCLNDLNTQSA
jgi:hypothetical protein